MTSENSQMASRALQICLMRGFIELTTSGWHWGEGRATDLASAPRPEGEVSEATTSTERTEKASDLASDGEENEDGERVAEKCEEARDWECTGKKKEKICVKMCKHVWTNGIAR